MNNWYPGSKIDSPVENMLQIDPVNNNAQDNYRLLIGAIVPRPTALVSTINGFGQMNLAPFSFFNGVSSNPPSLMIAIAPKKDGAAKDSLANIRETGEFVVNSASDWMAEPLVHCAAAYPQGVSEFEKSGFTALPSVKVKPCRVKEAPVHFECRVSNLLSIGPDVETATTMVIGEIVMFHVWDKAYHQGKIDSEILKPLARLGGIRYAHVTDGYDLAVPDLNQQNTSRH